MSNHYYSKRPSTPRRRTVISDVIRGIPIELITEPGVFSPKRIDPGTRLLIENLDIPEKGTALDMGCGYGVIGIILAKINPALKVYLVDINKRTIELAKINAKINKVQDRVIVLQGNLYEPVRDKKFNLIASNPPISAGLKIVEEIVEEAKNHLVEKGIIEIVLRKGVNTILSLMEKTYGNVEIVARKSGYKVLKSIKY